MNNNTEHSEDFNQYISFYDLEMNEPEWQEAWKSQDKDRVEALLYKWGCDINYGWEIKVCAHRPRLQIRETGWPTGGDLRGRAAPADHFGWPGCCERWVLGGAAARNRRGVGGFCSHGLGGFEQGRLI